MSKFKKAFTLVELIISITIVAILGAIAFISLQGYSKTARDSTRVSDLSTMKSSLELFHLSAGKYPNTTAGFNILYSGSTVWMQGIFGEDTKNNLDRLDKIPKDPLTNKEYTYSITKTKQEYQLAGIIEGSEIAFSANLDFIFERGINTLVTKTNAGETIATALVIGNYNGVLFKTENLGNCEILSVPSIVSTEGELTTDLVTILKNKNLVYNGFNNLPSNYIGSKYKTTQGFDFESNQLVLYSDNEGCKKLYNPDNIAARTELITNIKKAYSGTIIQNIEEIKGFIEIDTSDTEVVKLLSTSLVNNSLGGNLTSYKSEALVCNEGEHIEDGICVLDSGTCEIVNGTGINTWNGNDWECNVKTCGTDYYNPGDNTCTEVGIGYYSSSTSITRTACTNNPDTASRDYTYTGDGNGTNACTTSYTQKCGVDFYETSDGVCTAVGTGFYSPNLNNTRTVCTNNPDNSSKDYTYTGDGNGTNACTTSYTAKCGIDFYETSDGVCTAVGTGFYSPNLNNTRTACTNNPDNSSRDYTYIGDGNGTNACTTSYTAKCGIDFYETSDGICTAVGIGYYSANLNNSRVACTNKPTGGTYTSDGNGTNSCSYSVPKFTYFYGSSKGGTSVIKDNTTGYYWQSNGTISGAKPKTDAVSYCSGLVLGGKSNWMLPTKAHLESLRDSTFLTYFTVSTTNKYYWSATVYSGDSRFYRYTYDNSASYGFPVYSYSVRCISTY